MASVPALGFSSGNPNTAGLDGVDVPRALVRSWGSRGLRPVWRRWAAHVDMARMGTADRWADIAVATWSCDWNYGPGWQSELLAAYGVAPDEERTAYYRLLWDLT